MKKSRTKWVGLLCSLFVIMAAAPVQAGYMDDGTYRVETPYMVDIDYDGIDDAYIFRPVWNADETRHHPIMVFCVGTGGDPMSEPTTEPDRDGYIDILTEFASHGIVVIAGTRENQNQYSGTEYPTQFQALAALDWLIYQAGIENSGYDQKLNTGKIISMGHSQGGAACINLALRDARVTAVAALMPGLGVLGRWQYDAVIPTYKDINVPILYVTGQDDGTITPASVRLLQYANTRNAPAWYGTHAACDHFHVPDTMLTTLKAWLYAHLYGEESAIDVFYSDSSDWSLGDGWITSLRKGIE